MVVATASSSERLYYRAACEVATISIVVLSALFCLSCLLSTGSVATTQVQDVYGAGGVIIVVVVDLPYRRIE